HGPAGPVLPDGLLGAAAIDSLLRGARVEGDLEGPERAELVRGGVRGTRAEAQAAFAFGCVSPVTQRAFWGLAARARCPVRPSSTGDHWWGRCPRVRCREKRRSRRRSRIGRLNR